MPTPLAIIVDRISSSFLSDHGFVLEPPTRLTRRFGPLTHLICFQKGVGPLKDEFTASFGWRLDFYSRDSAEMDHWIRIGFVEAREDRWFPLGGQTEATANEVGLLLVQHAIPYLNKFRTVESIAELYDETKEKAVGPMGRPLNLGLAYAYLGRNDDARRVLRNCIAVTGMPAWHAKYRKMAQQALDELNQVIPEPKSAKQKKTSTKGKAK